MTYTVLYSIWGVMFVLTAGLGFIPSPEGALRVFLQILAIAFFVPGWLILHKAGKEKNNFHRKVIRNLCFVSLGLTVVLLVLNLMSAGWSEAVGNGLHAALTVVSAPMVCGNTYVLSLFLWGCLLMGSMGKKKK